MSDASLPESEERGGVSASFRELEGEPDRRALAAFLSKPLDIGNARIKGRLCLAPMAGLGHVAFREVMAGYGGQGLLFTGMMNARALPTENPRTSSVFRWREAELPYLAAQIFGNEPEIMAAAARRLEDAGFFGVDINMGCSVSAIMKRGCGAALLRDPERAVAIVRAVRKAVRFPVFVKFRTGFSADPGPAVELARRFEREGADALTFHPRIAPDRRTQRPRLEHLKLVKECVSVPVFGNGDVFTPADCATMLERTGCDGVAVGRMAVARPWLFAAWAGNGNGGFLNDDPTENPGLWREAPLRLMDAVARHFDPALPVQGNATRGLNYVRKFLLYFAANFTWGNVLFPRWVKGRSIKEIRSSVARDLEALPEDPQVAARPNMLMFMQ